MRRLLIIGAFLALFTAGSAAGSHGHLRAFARVCSTVTSTVVSTVYSTITQTVTVTTGTTTTGTTTGTTTTAPPPPPPPPPTCPTSLQAAYTAAGAGAVIDISGCSFNSSQTITGSKTSVVTLQASAGSPATVSGDITNSANNLTLRGINASGVLDLSEANVNASNVVFDRMHGSNFLIGPSHDITLSNSDIGPQPNCGVENTVGPDGNIPDAVPYNISLIGNYIHDQNGDNSVSGCHYGGLFLIAGHDFLIAGNKFERNVVYDIQIQNFTGIYGGAPSNLTIENNWFAGPVEWLPNDTQFDNQPNVQFDCRANACSYTNVLVRYNSFYDGVDFRFDGNNTLTNVRAVGNIGRGSNCSGAVYSYNVWGDGACGSSDVVAQPSYVDGSIASPDYHLSGGLAVDLVPGLNPDQQLATDIDGQARPIGAGYDAGSDER
jgi:hypothetical protein